MRKVYFRIAVRFTCVIVAIGAAAQEPAKKGTSAGSQAQQISADLAQLGSLVQKLAITTQGASDQKRDTGWYGQPMVYFQDSYKAKTKPSEDAESTVMFSKGESANVLKWQNGWALAEDPKGNTGWVQDKALVIVDSVQNRIQDLMPQIIAQLQAMKAKYQQGPIRLSGFAVDIKFPPGVSVDFEFKEPK